MTSLVDLSYFVFESYLLAGFRREKGDITWVKKRRIQHRIFSAIFVTTLQKLFG